MAGWLLRAIVMENVSARAEGPLLDLPAGPAYRLEKEIKNVVTVIAKTCHYWTGHMWLPQQRTIAALLAAMAAESPVVAPALATDGVPDGHDRAFAALAEPCGATPDSRCRRTAMSGGSGSNVPACRLPCG